MYIKRGLKKAIKKGFEMNFDPLNSIRKSTLQFLQSSRWLKGSMKNLVEQNPFVDISKYEW